MIYVSWNSSPYNSVEVSVINREDIVHNIEYDITLFAE